MTIQEVINLIKKHSQDNYRDGSPQIPPHQHDGVDNLQVNPINFLGYPIFNVTDATVAPTDNVISGTIRFQYDGTNFTMWVMNETSWEQVGGGGGGGTPGGSDTDIQFNDSGSFGGDSNFTYDKNNIVVTLKNGGAISGSTDGITITTDNVTVGDASDIFLQAGNNSASNHIAGNIVINAGDRTGVSSTAVQGGSVSINAGNSGGTYDGGDVQLESGNSRTTSTENKGNIYLISSDNGLSASRNGIVKVIYNLVIDTSASNVTQHDVGGTGCKNTIWINDGVAPSSNPGYGGILYVESGALKYMGSGGTVTTIAPA